MNRIPLRNASSTQPPQAGKLVGRSPSSSIHSGSSSQSIHSGSNRSNLLKRETPRTSATKVDPELQLLTSYYQRRIDAIKGCIPFTETAIERAIADGESIGVNAQRERESALKKERELYEEESNKLQREQQRLQELKEQIELLQRAEIDTERLITKLTEEDLPCLEIKNKELQSQIPKHEKKLQQYKTQLNQLMNTKSEMSSATYGLSEEATHVVEETETVKKRCEALRLEMTQVEMERRSVFSEYEALKGTIRVYCRIKKGDDPLPEKQNPSQDSPFRQNTVSPFKRARSLSPSSAGPILDWNGSTIDTELTKSELPSHTIRVSQPRSHSTTGSAVPEQRSSSFTYDHVFPPDATQSDVFREVEALVDSAVDGYRVCVMAYGQTGSGKTYTMEGTPKTIGITPRAVSRVFERIEELTKEGWEYQLTCSFVEIYNECLRDLLNKSLSYHRLALGQGGSVQRRQHKIIHEGYGDVVLTDVIEHEVKEADEIHKLLQFAQRNRSTAKTSLNDRSSRSHCIFLLRIRGVNASAKQQCRGGLCLVDLAGSERVHSSGAEGLQLREAISINKSLMHLGDCIRSLGEINVAGTKQSASSTRASIPRWRNSRLTYLLQNYIAGEGCKTLLVATITCNPESIGETLNTLRFAAKAGNTEIGIAKQLVEEIEE